jgi:hypothetical protein
VASADAIRQRFPLRFTRAYAIAARPFGVTPSRAWVEVADGELRARFGPWRVRTPLSNVRSWSRTGPYRFLKTAGPARLGVTDRGLTFAGNGDGGLLICFRTPVPGIDPLALLRHPELTVTVADPDALADALAQATSAERP